MPPRAVRAVARKLAYFVQTGSLLSRLLQIYGGRTLCAPTANCRDAHCASVNFPNQLPFAYLRTTNGRPYSDCRGFVSILAGARSAPLHLIQRRFHAINEQNANLFPRLLLFSQLYAIIYVTLTGARLTAPKSASREARKDSIMLHEKSCGAIVYR